MRIKHLEIRNFRNLRHLHLTEIPSLIVVAGPNGSGKTSLFDALRVFKEAIAEYSVRSPGASFVHQLMEQLGPVVTIGEPEATIVASILLTEHERRFLELPEDHSAELTGKVTVSKSRPGRADQAQVDSSSADHVFLRRLFGERYEMGGQLGVLDHIGPDRRFTRTEVTTINFSQDYAESELHRLVLTSTDKFASLSQDLVLMRLVDLMEKEQGLQERHEYIEGVRSIFAHFLPDKQFIDVKISPDLMSPPQILVRSGGIEHDINQLSSGQREVLMTYTHLEKLRPTSSVVLFDEPELHLHPSLQRRVIAHLNRLLERGENQIWVASHSEEIVGTTPQDRLFAMTDRGAPAIEPVRDQAARIELLRQLGASIGLQLTSPRILFLEGESDAVILPLFFETLPASLSVVDTGGKGNLMRLTPAAMKLLEEVITEGKFYLVRDRDVEDDPEALDAIQEKYRGHFFAWDRYHIENYLLDEEAIYSLLKDDPDLPTPVSVSEIHDQLRAAADRYQDGVLAKHLEARLNPGLRARLRLNVPEGVKQSLMKATQARLERTKTSLDPAEVERLYNSVEADLASRWPSEWRSLCVGRDVLKAYHVSQVAPALSYDVFRNRVARTIRELERVPKALQDVIASVTEGLS